MLPPDTCRDAMPRYAFGPFLLDVSERQLLRDGHVTPLTPKTFDLLRVLVEHSGHLLSKEELLQEVWPGSFVEESNLNRHVSILRKTLGDGTEGRKYIETVPTRGYRFVAPVTEAAPARTSLEVCVAEQSMSESPSAPLHDASTTRRMRSAARIRMRAGTAAAVILVGIALGYMLVTIRPSGSPRLATPSPLHRQVTFAGQDGSPTLSPDGRRIAYVSTTADRRRIVVQELAGGQPVTVFSATETGYLRWSPDGSDLLFFARDDGPGGLFVLPRLGGVPRRIMTGGAVASWSPDGSRIAVAQNLAGKIWMFDRAGRSDRAISIAGAERGISDLDWSPVSGQIIAVANDLHGHYTIWTIRPDGSEQRKILVEDAEIPSARWAPRGNAIYYFRRKEQTVSLFKVPFSSDPRRQDARPSSLLTGLETDGAFAISSDGKQLVYARAPFYSNLWMVDASVARSGRVTATTQLTQGTSLIERPTVSPDGQRVLFNVGHEPLANLYTIPVTGGPPKPLTALHSFSVGGAWSADGLTVAFASTEGGQPHVWVVNATGGTPRAVSSGDLSDSFELSWSPTRQIVYQQAGNRNYYVLDPTTGRERFLLTDASLGWVFSPRYSPDGTKIAFAWSRQKDYGLWIMNTRDSSQKLVYGSSVPTPIGWSADGAWIYALEGKRATYRGTVTYLGETLTEAKVLKVSESGAATTLFALPFAEVGGVAVTPDGRRLICAVYSSRSDVWIVENFDASEGR